MHITVASSPAGAGSGLNAQRELVLLKTALLYGDRVKLYSPIASLVVQIAVASESPPDNVLRDVLKGAQQADPQYGVILEVWKELERKKNKTRQEIIALQGIKRRARDMVDVLRGVVAEAGVEDLVDMLDSGRVEMEQYDLSDLETALRLFFDQIGEAIISGTSYPLLDDATGDLIQAALRDGILPGAPAGQSMAKVVGLASDALARIPLFEDATVGQCLQIRDELSRPLVRFRSAIGELAGAMEAAPWGPNFKAEVELVFREKIEPAALELEEEIEGNTFIRSFARTASNPLQMGALAFAVTRLTDFADVTGAAWNIGAFGAGMTSMAIREWKSKAAEIERNQLYFYVTAARAVRGDR